MIIAIDFDGTCVTNEYPFIGKNIGAVPVLKQIINAGHRLVLYTMRSGCPLKDAVEWFKGNNIPLWGINENPTQKDWTDSPKLFANLYIDDAGLGISLIYTKHGEPYVDWLKVCSILNGQRIINCNLFDVSREVQKELDELDEA